MLQCHGMLRLRPCRSSHDAVRMASRVPRQPTFEMRVTMLLKMQSSQAWANVVNVGNPDAKALVPLTPAAFDALLQTRTFTNGAWTSA